MDTTTLDYMSMSDAELDVVITDLINQGYTFVSKGTRSGSGSGGGGGGGGSAGGGDSDWMQEIMQE